MGTGRLPAWTGLIQPYYDRPDIQVPIVWYEVPNTAPVGPVSPFVDRFWDERREAYLNLGVGTTAYSMTPYWGPVPAAGVGPLYGTLDQWAGGLSYADAVAHPPSGVPCFSFGPSASPIKARQGQRIALDVVGGCRARVVNCPGEAVPCQLDYKVTIGASGPTYDRGTVSQSGNSHVWSGVGSTQTWTFTENFPFNNGWVGSVLGRFTFAGATCGPFAYSATRTVGSPHPITYVLLLGYPGTIP